MDLKIGREDVDLIHLAYGPVTQWQPLVNSVMNFQVP
jgi:hypothetical protein